MNFKRKLKNIILTIETLNTKKKDLESKLVGLRNQFDSSTLNNESGY